MTKMIALRGAVEVVKGHRGDRVHILTYPQVRFCDGSAVVGKRVLGLSVDRSKVCSKCLKKYQKYCREADYPQPEEWDSEEKWWVDTQARRQAERDADV